MANDPAEQAAQPETQLAAAEPDAPVWGGPCVICRRQVIDGRCAHCGYTPAD